MSDLVEKVGDIIAARIAACEPCDDIARAAIAVVLGHLADNVSDDMLRDMHDAWIEWNGQDSGRWEYCLKAALRAAAGSAPTTPEVK